MRGAQQVLRGMFDVLSAAKTLNERIGFRIRTQKRRNFSAASKSSASASRPFEFRLAHRRLPFFKDFPRGCA